MKKTIVQGFAAAAAIWTAASAFSQEVIFENFGENAPERWDYVADGVMGGVSKGEAVIGLIDGKPGIRLTGDVSTQNNGGFIQVRRLLPNGLPTETTGIALEVRGNSEPYYVFIRTSEMLRPWYFYKAEFDADPNWSKIEIPFGTFQRSHAHLSDDIAPTEVTSIGLVAYGRDHQADLMVRNITLF